MADNVIQSKGRGAAYKFDRGGVPAEFGPFIGIVKNNVDPTRSGRLQVYIEQFAGSNPDDASLWRTVSYIPPFYGVTPRNNATGSAGTGSYKGNQQSYGMWFTPPDLGVQVICFFVGGDPTQGYYLGCVPEPGVVHMIPAIGASRKFVTKNDQQQAEIDAAEGKQMPVVEINQDNPALEQNPRFFDQEAPIHDYVYTILYNQGLLGDFIRGPISSSAQRESPSAVFGMSTPGRPIFQGVSGISNEEETLERLKSGDIKIEDIKIEGRRGGHSFVMDDGDVRGRDNLIRIRTAKGHQITMSDEADCFYFIHANGQTWIEMGSEGTVDVYTTNSINFRTQGDVNIRADNNINLDAAENFNVRAKNIHMEAQENLKLTAVTDLTAYSKGKIGVLSDGSLNLQAKLGGWKTSAGLKFRGSRIDLNGPAPETVTAPKPIVEYKLDDTKFVSGVGWQKQEGTLETIVPRAPTHEPYPYHNRGVPVEVELSAPPPSPPPAAVTSALASTAALPVSTPINTAEVLSAPPADIKIGNLDKTQVTGLLASAKAATGQAADVISIDKGIGEFGFKPDQLEASGYLKPGTLSSLQNVSPGAVTAADIEEANRIIATGGNITPELVARNRQVNKILESPTVWSGQKGVSGISGLLSDSKLQNQVQQGLMSKTFDGLRAQGLASGTESAAVLGSLVQGATKLGVGSVDSFVKGIAPPDISQALGSIARDAQFSTAFVDEKLGAVTALSRRAESVTGTVNRAALDSAVTESLGDTKIPAPNFKPQEREEDEPSPLEEPRNAISVVVEEYVAFLDEAKAQVDPILTDAIALEERTDVNLNDVNALDNRFQAFRQFFNSQQGGFAQRLRSAREAAPPELEDYGLSVVETTNNLVRLVAGLAGEVRAIIARLRERLGTVNT